MDKGNLEALRNAARAVHKAYGTPVDPRHLKKYGTHTAIHGHIEMFNGCVYTLMECLCALLDDELGE